MNRTAFLEAIDTLFENFSPLERQLIAHEVINITYYLKRDNNNNNKFVLLCK